MSQWSDSERGGGEGLHSLKLTPAQKGDFVRASTMREREGDTAKWGQSQYRYRQFLIETQRASDTIHTRGREDGGCKLQAHNLNYEASIFAGVPCNFDRPRSKIYGTRP